ncbi:MAG TPA: glycosyltransferase family 87 protein [Candidatus Limnocylindria bacterium]
MTRAIVCLGACVIAFAIAFAGWHASPASYDFLALYSSARLVATGHAADVADRDAILRVEHETRPERTLFLNNPNPPALSLVLAPLGALPFDVAYVLMLALLVAALAASAFLLAPLAPPGPRAWLFPFAMLAPASLIALVQGQTTPLVLLAIAASLRVAPRRSGLLVAAVAFRPQLLPIFAVVALVDRERRWPFVAGVTAIALVSLALIGPSGLPGYVDLVTSSAGELRPVDIGLPSLVRRVLGGDAFVNLTVSAALMVIGAVAVMRLPRDTRVPAATAWSVLASPHALMHDGVIAYPAVAAVSRDTRGAAMWVGAGIGASIVQQAGLPVAALYLLALAIFTLRR